MATLNVIYRIAANIDDLARNVDRGVGTMDRMERRAMTLGKALGGMFLIDKALDYGKALVADADALTKLHDRTSISIRGLQVWRAAADDAGNTLEELINATNMMQDKLAGGTPSFLTALQEVGIELGHFRELDTQRQFEEIAEAIAKVADPADQVRLAGDLLGERLGRQVLPTLKKGFKDLADEVATTSEEAVSGLDTFGDAIVRLGRTASTIFKEIIGRHLDEAMKGGLFGYILGDRSASEVQSTLKTMEKTVELLNKLPRVVDTKAPNIGLPTLPSDEEIARLDRLGRSRLEMLRQEAEAQEKASRLAESYRESWNDIGMRQREDAAALMAFHAAYEAALKKELAILESTFDITKEIGFVWEDIALLTPAGSGGWLSGVDLEPVFEQTRNWKDSLSEVVTVLGVIGDRWASLAVGILRNSQAIVALWGTNKGAAVGMAIGAAGQFIPTNTTAGKVGFGAAQGAATGAAFGSIIPGLGTLVGGAIGAGIGAIVGWIQSQKAHKQVNDLRDAFIEAAGGLGALDRKAHDAGMTLTRILDAKTPQEYQRAIEELNAAFAFQDQSIEALNAAIERYGFSIEELGPALSQQKLDEQVMQLLTDFRLLEGAGVDVETISLHMADAINEYLHNAMRAGATIPAAFREILQQLVTMGLLTDLNGDLITDLEQSGITFSETLDEKFSTLIDTINRMVDAIARFLGITQDAADEVANFPDFPDNAGHGLPDTPRLPDLDARGGGGVIEIHTHTDLDGREIARVVTHVQNDDMSFRNQLRAA